MYPFSAPLQTLTKNLTAICNLLVNVLIASYGIKPVFWDSWYIPDGKDGGSGFLKIKNVVFFTLVSPLTCKKIYLPKWAWENQGNLLNNTDLRCDY